MRFAIWLLVSATLLLGDEYADLFRQAAVAAQNGQYEQAIKEYRAALVLRPASAEAINNIAVISYQLGRYGEAFDFASKIWQTHPELKSASLITGMAAVQLNRPNEAIAPLKALLKADSENRDALLALASAWYALHNYEEAIGIYEREINLKPQDSAAWYGMAICYERSAEQASEKLAHMPGGGSFSKLMLAQYLQSAGDDKLAAEAFGQSASVKGTESAEARIEYESARGFALKAKEAFERFVSLAPDSWQTAVFLGDVARQHGDLVAAIAHYKEGLAKQPDSAGAFLGLGTAYWEMGDFDQATGYLRHVLKLSAHATQAVFELANIAIRQHREVEAIPLLKDYLAAEPDALAARADLGRAYLHLGQFSNAVTELELASANDDRGEIHFQLSQALRKLGRTDEAETAAKESVSLRQAQLKREQDLHADK